MRGKKQAKMYFEYNTGLWLRVQLSATYQLSEHNEYLKKKPLVPQFPPPFNAGNNRTCLTKLPRFNVLIHVKYLEL